MIYIGIHNHLMHPARKNIRLNYLSFFSLSTIPFAVRVIMALAIRV